MKSVKEASVFRFIPLSFKVVVDEIWELSIGEPNARVSRVHHVHGCTLEMFYNL